MYIIAALFLPETFSPIILSYKASILRQETGNQSHQAEHDEASLTDKLKSTLSRIIYFIFREPTTIFFGIYITVLYLLIYGFLEGFDYVFTKTYLFAIGERYTCFAAIAIGVLLGMPYVILVNRFATKRYQSSGDNPPERRLLPALFAAPLLPISLFWLGWTNNPSISYWSDLGACCLFGFALHALFTSTYHYLLDTYGTVASSALAAITCVRYLASGGMVIITEPMYKGLGVNWTLTLLGCVAALLTPVPLIFWKWGPLMRKKSKYAE